MRPWIRRHLGVVLVGSAVAVTATGAIVATGPHTPVAVVTPTPTATATPTPTATATAAPGGCTRTATTSTLTTQINAAVTDDVICLAAGNYGTWQGTGKRITIRGAAGNASRMTVDFGNGDANFTLDGIGGLSGNVAGTARDFVIRNSEFTSQMTFSMAVNANILLERNTHNNIGTTGPLNRIHVPIAGGQSGITVKDSHMEGGSADGIQTGGAITVLNTVFKNINEASGGCGDCHTDCFQGFWGVGSTLIGNTFDNCSQAIGVFDGGGGMTIAENVIVNMTGGRPYCIELLSDSRSGGPSTIEYNVCRGSRIFLGAKSGNPAGVGTIVRGNITNAAVGFDGGSSAAVNSGNLYPGATSPNINGSPTFVGGAAPANWAGHCLSPLSAGWPDVGLRRCS